METISSIFVASVRCAHMDRLLESARRVAIELPVSRETLRAEVEEAVEASTTEGEMVVRLQVTRGSGPLGLGPTTARDPLRVILVEPTSLPPLED